MDRRNGVAIVGALLMGIGVGCSGSDDARDPAADKATGALLEPGLEPIPDAFIDAAWVVELGTEEALQGYASQPGWVSLVMKRDYRSAVAQLGPGGGVPAARAHLEAAMLFRQAALLSAYSLIEVYGKTPQPTDPAGTAHLLMVSYGVTGDVDAARRAALGVQGLESDPTGAWSTPWLPWLASDAAWPPDLSLLPIELGVPTPGGWPTVEQLPHYSLPEREGSTASRDMADPGALVALALWHDAAAEAADPKGWGALRSTRAGYRFPAEAAYVTSDDANPDMLFGSDLLVPGDAPYLADLHGTLGREATDAHTGSSLLAWMANDARGEDGMLDHEKALDRASQLRDTLLRSAAAQTGGTVQAHQREFADIAKVGALRSLALVAEIEGDRETSGQLRVNARDMSERSRACPVGLLGLAAWDASNRYPMRALDLLHVQARRYPSLEVARYGLDVLGLRVSNERIETPGM